MSSRLCRICNKWHDLTDDWPLQCAGHFGERSEPSGIQIIKDIEPYQAIAADKETGRAPSIGGRRQHREFLKRNGYIEVGNERPKPIQTNYNTVTPREVRRVFEELRDGRKR